MIMKKKHKTLVCMLNIVMLEADKFPI